jgi:O-antigen/teichoic acid export membrane protein
MSRSTRAANGFLTGALQYVARIVLQGLLAPVVLKLAGRETLGAYAVLIQTIAYLALVDFGLSFSLERYLAQATAVEDDGRHFRNVFTTARTFLLATNFVFAGLVLIASFYVGHFYHFSPLIERQARIAMWITALWGIARTPLSAYNIAMIATQDLAAANIIGALVNFARALVALAAVACGYGLIGLILAGTVAEALGAMVYRLRFRRRNPARTPHWGIPERGLLREMLIFGAWVFLANIAGMLVFNSGNVFVGYLFGAATVSIFYTTYTPALMGSMMVLRLGDSAAPAINELYARGDRARLKHVYTRVSRWSILLASMLAIGLLLFNRDLVTCWVGRQQYGGGLMTSCLVVFVLLIALEHVNVVFAYAFGWARALSVIAVFQAAANAAMALFFGRRFGMGGVILAVVIALVPRTVYMVHRFSRELDIPILSLGYRTLSPALAPAIAGGAVGMLASLYLPGHGWLKFLMETSVFACVFLLTAYLWATTEEDRLTGKKAMATITAVFGVSPPALGSVEGD